MSSGPTEAARLQLSELLGRVTLRLAPGIVIAPSRPNLVALKEPSGPRYLVIQRDDWPLLQLFGTGRTVSDVLCEVISENRCPPLREFYELVVKAYQQCLLLAAEEPDPEAAPVANWRVPLPGRVARIAAITVIALSLVALLATRVQVPANAIEVVISVLLAFAAANLSQVLAACVLEGAECAVYRPRFDWKTPAPRFRVDLDDAVMGGRDTEVNVALVRMVPPFLFAAVAALEAPPYCLPLLGAVFLNVSPLWRSPMLDLLRAIFRDPRLSVGNAFVAASSRPEVLLSRARYQLSDRKFLLANVVAAATWLALAFITGCVLLQANARALLHRFYAGHGLRYTELVVIGAVAAVVLGIAVLVAWIVFRRLLIWWRERAERRRRMRIAVTSPEAVAEFLSDTVLFRDLPAEVLQEVATVMHPVQHARGEYVIRAGEEASQLFVLVSGRLEVVRHFGEDKAQAVAEMFPGDVLGEIGVIRGETRSRSIRCATRSILLALDKADFERLVLPCISRADVEQAVQKVGFLQNVPLVKNWSQASLSAFARLAKITEYEQGDVIMQEGMDNLFLHLVHRGEFEVTQRGKRLRKLKQGDSFGEVGMLQNNAATATVTAMMAGSCLVVPKTDFLRFITQDYAISLQFEQIGTKRLGKQVFHGKKAPGFNAMRG